MSFLSFISQINNCACYVGFVGLIHTKHKFGQGGLGLHTLQLVSLCSVQRPLSCLCACVGVLACLRFACCTEHVLHGIYMLLFVQSRLCSVLIWYLHWGKRKMAAHEVEGQRLERFIRSGDGSGG